MKRSIAITCLLFVAVFVLGPAASSSDLVKEFEKIIAFEPGNKLIIENYKGTIELIPWDRKEVDVFARIETPEEVDPEYGAAVVAATEIRIEETRTSLTIKSNYDKLPGKKGADGTHIPFIHYRIHAPAALNLDIEDYKSNISLAGFNGKIDIETYKGTITIKEQEGHAEIETYKGTGTISLMGSIELETYKGEIIVDMKRIDADLSAETYKGSITFIIDQNQGLNLDADLGRKGSFTNDFNNSSDLKENGKVRGTINGGGKNLEFETYKGELIIKAR